MKRFIVTAVMASLISGAAFAENPTNVVSSANVVGYNQITLVTTQYNMVALSFDNPSNTVQQLFPSLPKDTKAFIWNTAAQGYVTCLKGPANWGTTGTNRILKGGGCYLLLPATAGTTNIYLAGDVPTVASTNLFRSAGYTMLSYPYPVDVAVSNMAVAKASKKDDVIYIWTGSGYQTLLRGPANWGTGGTNIIKIGQAYYYKSTTSTNATEVKPYTLD